jgi:hypothetical protein
MQDAAGNVNVNGETAAHGERACGLEFHIRAIDPGGRFLLPGTVSAGECLRAQAGSGVGEVDEGGGMLDGNGPVIAGHIPVELVILIEEPSRVANRVIDVDGFRGIDRIGNIDFQVAVSTRGAGIIFQCSAGVVHDAVHLQEERVIGAVRTGILERNGAMDSVPLAIEDEIDAFFDVG